MSAIRFYLDENISPQIAAQLKQRGIDAITTKEIDQLGDDDRNHLERAAALGRVICTQDQDFLRLHTEGLLHSGIAFGQRRTMDIGTWVNRLVELYAAKTAEEMVNQIYFVPSR